MVENLRPKNRSIAHPLPNPHIVLALVCSQSPQSPLTVRLRAYFHFLCFVGLVFYRSYLILDDMGHDDQMKTLQDYRNRIDELDNQIIALLEERFAIVRKVGHHKAQNSLEVVQTARVTEVLGRVRALAAQHNLDPDMIANLYEIMIDHAHVLENGIRKTYDKN